VIDEEVRAVDRLDDAQREAAARRLDRWTVTAQDLTRTIDLPGAWPQVVDLVDRIAALAQAMDHHPDLSVAYARVGVRLTSHDAGGVTEADVALAEAIDRAAARVTASAPSPGYDAKTKEAALRALTYGLVVIGARAGDEHNGMTANWITQVSFDPCLVEVAIENDARTCDLLHRGGVFSVNVVPAGREDLVEHFVKPQCRAGDKLGDVAATDGPQTGAPILADAAAAFECRVVGVHAAGDHTVFVGEVVGASLPAPGEAMTLKELGWHYGG